MPKFPKLSFAESLGEVVLPEKCMGCAACVVVCPVGCLDYVDEKPVEVEECKVCGICAQVCPRYEFPLPALEEFTFGRTRKPEEEFGVYRRIVVARSQDEDVRRVCQDGGAVSSLLRFALRTNAIDGAAVSGTSENRPFHPVPRLVTTPEEVLKCAGTKYSYSPNLLAFNEGVKQKKTSMAFVGTPCQIQAIRRIQTVPLRKHAERLNFAVGLMCTESFTYEGLIEKHIKDELNINPRDIKKMNIKAKILVTTESGDVEVIPLKTAKQYTRASCLPCTDFSAELADISAGGLGLGGWTLSIIRTKKGEEIFEKAEEAGLLETKPVEEEGRALDLLVRLSKKKRGE
ncbi:MAG: Coenzyme F420 hydrogenase/dehydrogenase, beta subunit C-terminal domain [Candidatus Bathyarchaeota archaeon]|nr:MAG: Coenzyme F420 hydrogenase/dehydrogenase, beta subunit C-terminal domain [Candidatus Bathyarchaeota archaeon]